MNMNFRRVATVALLAVALAVQAAQPTFNLYSPANGLQKNTGSTYINSAATSSDVISLWSGSCSGLTFLRGDGACSNTLTGVSPLLTLFDTANSANRFRVVADGGVLIGNPTGGSQGPGTINASALYIDGAPVGTSTGAVSSVGLSAPGVFSVSGSPVTSAGTLGLSFASGQTANSFLATPNGSTGSLSLRTIVAADLPALGANPTGTIGLTAVNGSAQTYLRSDGAPALSQAIVPTWTGAHTFNVGDGIRLVAPAATSARLAVAGNAGTPYSTSFDMIQDSAGIGYLLNRANAGAQIWTNSLSRLEIGAAGNAVFNSPSSGATVVANNADNGVNLNAKSASGQIKFHGYHSSFSGAFMQVRNGADSAYAPLNISASSIQLSPSTGGTTFGSAGNVTIANPSSGASLTLTNDQTTTDALRFVNGGTRTWYMGPGTGSGADDFAILYDYTRGASVMRADNAGTVFISPTANGIGSLSVRGNAGNNIAIEARDNTGVYAIHMRPNVTGVNIISSDYYGGSYLPLAITARGTTTDFLMGSSGGATMGAPTGGNKGDGTINVSGGFYVNNVAVTGAAAKMAAGRVNGTGGCTISNALNMTTPCTKNSTGNYTISFNSYFSTYSHCTATPDGNGSPIVFVQISLAAPPSGISVFTTNSSGTATDANFFVTCMGN